jgi:hypothetical protein
MKLTQEYALEHVRDGLTTLEEVQRVAPLAPPAASGAQSHRSHISSPQVRFMQTSEGQRNAPKIQVTVPLGFPSSICAVVS